MARREIKDRLVRLDFTLYRMRILGREHTVSTVGLAMRPSQLPSSDDVEVEVVHRLAATGAVIDGDPEALAEPLVLVSRKSVGILLQLGGWCKRQRCRQETEEERWRGGKRNGNGGQLTLATF